MVLWAVGDKMNYLFEMKKSIHDYHCKHNQHCRAFAHISKKILIAGTERFTKGTNCVINLLHMYSYIRRLLRILSIITFKWVKKISMVTQHACVKSWE